MNIAEKHANQYTDFKKLSRSISLVENESKGYENILTGLPESSARIVGITGSPGAGKSSLTDAFIREIVADGKKAGVLCIDPSSPFNKGALLGDRIRMSQWYNHPDVFIRSLASRGALGGLHPRIMEIASLMGSAGIDYVIVETVGVGQSEIDIAGLADVTVLVLVPEGGDIIQTMKAGIMEIADVFVINKFDRPGADTFFNHLKKMLSPAFNNKSEKIPVFKTVASESKGVDKLYDYINSGTFNGITEKHLALTVHRAWSLIARERMADIDPEKMKNEIRELMDSGNFNLYRYVQRFR